MARYRKGSLPLGIPAASVHHVRMIRRCLAFLLIFSAVSFGDIIEDVRRSLAMGSFATADQHLQEYRAHHSITPEYLEALSWMARAAASQNQMGAAESYAKQTEAFARQLLTKRTLDAEPHLPTALGAAIEVQAQALVAGGYQPQAVALLKRDLTEFGKTSIAPRLQKNLNLLGMTGQPAPALQLSENFGSKPTPACAAQGISRAPLFLGALVRRL